MAPAVILRDRDASSVIDYYDRIAGALLTPLRPSASRS
jgi:hypothetical protein